MHKSESLAAIIHQTAGPVCRSRLFLYTASDSVRNQLESHINRHKMTYSNIARFTLYMYIRTENFIFGTCIRKLQ